MDANMRSCVICATKLSKNEILCPSCGFYQQERTLVDWEIKKLLENDIIIVDPILNLKEQLGSASLDLRLDGFFREFRFMEKAVIDLSTEIPENEYYNFRDLEIDKGECYFLQPGNLVLAQSFEYIQLPEFIAADLGGRSTLAKSGVEVHATSTQVTPGFSGHLTFELKNPGNMAVKLQPLGRIATLKFNLVQRVETPYKGKFQYQVKIKPPKPDEDLRRLDDFLQKKKI